MTRFVTVRYTLLLRIHLQQQWGLGVWKKPVCVTRAPSVGGYTLDYTDK